MEVESTRIQTLENGRKLIDVTMRHRPQQDERKQVRPRAQWLD